MNLDAELELWRRDWQSETAVPADLRRRVERQSRWMKIGLAGEILVTLVIGGGTIARALRSPAADMWLLAGMTWLFIVAAWTAALRINRGNWSPAALDTAAFVDLSIRRCRARLRALRFGVGLFVCEMAFCLGWIYLDAPQPRVPVGRWLLFGSAGVDIAWIASAAFAIFVICYGRRKRAELEYLVGMRP